MPEVIADQLLRKCGVPCPSYIARTVAPHRTELATSIYDRWVEEAYINKHEFTSTDWTSRVCEVASLPQSYSGVGLKKHKHLRYFAYWNAAALAVEKFTMKTLDNTAHPLLISPFNFAMCTGEFLFPQLF